jgi:hypothetical protein
MEIEKRGLLDWRDSQDWAEAADSFSGFPLALRMGFA